MSDNRCLLHKTKLEEFKAWLDSKGIQHRPGKGDWQVLQVQTTNFGWQVVFEKKDMPEHFTVNDKLVSVVREFINSSPASRTSTPSLHSQQEATERITQLESDLATAEQDSRQKQARIERLEAAVKELREALKVAVRQNDYDMLMTGDELRSCAKALKNTEDF